MFRPGDVYNLNITCSRQQMIESQIKPVHYIDERLSSKAAEADFAARRASGRARKKDAGKLDAVAAKIILENWLQSLPQ